MNRLNKTESAVFVFSYVFLASRGYSFRTYFIFIAAAVVPCGGRKTSSHTYSKCRLYFFWSFGIFGLILSQFENSVPLELVLGAWAVLHHYITAHEQIQ